MKREREEATRGRRSLKEAVTRRLSNQTWKTSWKICEYLLYAKPGKYVAFF